MSSVRDEGVIKFKCEWKRSAPPELAAISKLQEWRARLYRLQMIGVYPDGIGYGNLSARSADRKTFIVTGSQTGHLKDLTSEHYTRVTGYSFEKNEVFCEGPVRASSESLTHAMIYEMSPAIGAVVHVHHRGLWQKLLHRIPTTAKNVPYGTPGMAGEMKRLCREEGLMEKRILAMAGHEEGVISFGEELDQAGELLLDFYKKEIGPC